MNAFMVWARQYRQKLASQLPNSNNAEISVKLGQVWNELTNNEKKPFYEESERIKTKHKLDNPGILDLQVATYKRLMMSCGDPMIITC